MNSEPVRETMPVCVTVKKSSRPRALIRSFSRRCTLSAMLV